MDKNALRKLAGLSICESQIDEAYLDKATKEARLKLILQIAKRCGVDLDDADGEAVKKALLQAYAAGRT